MHTLLIFSHQAKTKPGDESLQNKAPTVSYTERQRLWREERWLARKSK
jgi:hypothetical protein